jgi:DNA-directed RNA polymerase specialized sigma24 family protein
VDLTGLFERACQGDHEAFGMLIAEHLARLDTAARLILRDPELARDAVREATLRAWKNLRGLRDPGSLAGWLHRLTVNACLDGFGDHCRACRRRHRGRVRVLPVLWPGDRDLDLGRRTVMVSHPEHRPLR